MSNHHRCIRVGILIAFLRTPMGAFWSLKSWVGGGLEMRPMSIWDGHFYFGPLPGPTFRALGLTAEEKLIRGDWI